MFLSHWFELSGVNEILAPQNENATPAVQPSETRDTQNDEDESPIWEILAPRSVESPRSNIRRPAANTNDVDDDDAIRSVPFSGDLVECQHCHKLTPVHRPRSTSVDSSTTSASSAAETESDDESAPPVEVPIDIQQLVMRAAVGAAQTTCCPKQTFDHVYKLFEVCAIPSRSARGSNVKVGVYNDAEPSKTIKKLMKLLAKNPSLVQSRSANMNNVDGLPDGFTLLHAACYGGNTEVVSFLLQEYIMKDSKADRSADDSTDVFEDDVFFLDLNDRDLQGRTALHVAAERGNVDILEMLREAYEKMQQIGDGKDVSDVNEALAGLSMKQNDSTTKTTNTTTSPNTPNATATLKNRSKSRSPKPPSRSPPPAFSGHNAPLDLAKRTPLALASTSPVPKARQNRKVLEKMLYGKGGDPCISGVERTPPKERCGGRIGGGAGVFSPPGKGGKTPRSSYLSPTPKKLLRQQQPPLTASSNYATPFESPPPSATDVSKTRKEKITRGLQWGVSEQPGWRFYMEDAMYCHYPLPIPPIPSSLSGNNASIPSLGLFGVFDGHGDGGFASKYISSHLFQKLASHPQWSVAFHSIDSDTNSTTEGDGAMMNLLMESFHELDEDLRKEPTRVKGGGTTAIVAVVSEGKIFVANVGDCRCILVKKRSNAMKNDVGSTVSITNSDSLEVIPLSEDHKPNLPCERARIESAGLSIHADHIPPEDDSAGPTVIYKVKKSDNDLLGVARAFGDFDYKSNDTLSSSRQAVICTPETVVRERHNNEDMYLVLACDGIWDVMSDDDVGLFVSMRVKEYCAGGPSLGGNEVLARVGDDLLNLCLEKGSRDNMSVLIVALPASGLGDSESLSSECSMSEAVGGAKRLAF